MAAFINLSMWAGCGETQVVGPKVKHVRIKKICTYAPPPQIYSKGRNIETF
jgi:hypothetical protein